MTKISFLFITLSFAFLSSCQPDSRQIIKDYYAGLNASNFEQITNCISDSLVTSEMEYVLTRNRSELYNQFQWDSVFQAHYEIMDIKQDSDAYEVTLSKNCKQIHFLQDTSITYKVRIDLMNSRISKIQLTHYMDLNFEKWQYRTESLIAWVDQNHPELSGFNNDLTKTGAQNYVMAVDLWKKSKAFEKVNNQ
jgi:hypothetical protein